MSARTDLARWLAAALLACASGAVLAQANQPADSNTPGARPSAPAAAPAPAAAGLPAGIQGQNILTLKDASDDPAYPKQSNGQRAQVQPGNNAPMWRAVGSGVQGYSSLPKSEAPEAGVLVQPFVTYPGSRHTTAGEAWREVRNKWLVPYGGSLVLIVLVALGIFYFARGAIGHADVAEGGRRIERFTPFERAAHWTNAIAFSILGISGLVMAFGKFFLLPIMGGQLFGWLTYALKNLHNFVGPLFVVSLVVMFVTFLRDNLPRKGDLRWLLRFGGMFSKDGREVPSHRFNAGEKVVFWGGVFLLGFFVATSGLVLDKLWPGITYDRQAMQYAHMVHNVATILMIAMFLGHIYIGTIGMRGAYSAMRNGWVGDAWAREHHAYWYEDIQAGKIPAERSTHPTPPEPVRAA